MIVALSANIKLSFSQTYQFDKYGSKDGLSEQYIYTINQDEKGFLWIGTGDGVIKYDGVEFKKNTTQNGLAENFISCSAQQKDGTIWLGHNRGGISRIIDGEIIPIISDALSAVKITDIIVDKNSYVWAISQNGILIKVSPELKIDKYTLFDQQKNVYSIAGNIEGKILVGTDEGLFFWRLNDNFELVSFEEIKGFEQKRIECITQSKYSNNDFWVGTAESGLYQVRLTEKGTFKRRHYDDKDTDLLNIKEIEEDLDKNLWVSTYTGLYKLIYDEELAGVNKSLHFNQSNGIGDLVNTSLIDMEGNLWVGMYGEGLAVLKDEIFNFYSHEPNGIPNDVRSIFLKDSVKWYGLSSGLLKITPYSEVKWKYYSSKNGFIDAPITNIVSRGDELFVGTDEDGLYRFNTIKEEVQKQFLGTSNLTNSVNKIIINENDLWVATEGGLLKIDLITNDIKEYNTQTGLSHNSVYDIMMLNDGSVVIGSHTSSLTFVKGDNVTYQKIIDTDIPMDVVAIKLDEENQLWLATLGNGVFKQKKDSFINISTEQGLKSDYCYSLALDNKYGVWVGHRGGMSRFSRKNSVVKIFDVKNGISDDFNLRATYNDIEDNIWFGTNKRLIKFNSKKFLTNTKPPSISIKNLFISDQKIPVTETIELPYDLYKIKIDFIGISFKQADGVKYEYYLKGYDLDWSESSSSSTVTYPRISDGEYTFYLKACNVDGFCTEKTLTFQLSVATPYWKKWWFIVLLISGVIFIFIYIVKKREANQKAVRKSLEVELDKRTAEVVRKSKDVRDSINYAQRIQRSILPSIKLMSDNFPESFVYFKPRDIVSGDFYWYERIGNKFIMICADCTGHGVPGAMLSMIASTLFKEIAHQHKIIEPSDFLYKLDELFKGAIKKSEQSYIHDGLDLSICLFDLDTNQLSFSGANRPVIICKENDLKRIKTSPVSIGGDELVEKEFKTINVQLEKGNSVYLFSDGFPDQFGGHRGKKLYLKGFEDVIKKSLDLNMAEQHLKMGEFFKEWKGEEEQVDDILVIGIKIS